METVPGEKLKWMSSWITGPSCKDFQELVYFKEHAFLKWNLNFGKVAFPNLKKNVLLISETSAEILFFIYEYFFVWFYIFPYICEGLIFDGVFHAIVTLTRQMAFLGFLLFRNNQRSERF